MKKLLALVLALVMSMSLVTISNAAFSDADKISHDEAVDVLNTLGVINGMPDGSFAPDGNVTRAEMAKMISIIMLGDVDASAFVGTATGLTDIKGHWAEGYIQYCYSQGIIAGKGKRTQRSALAMHGRDGENAPAPPHCDPDQNGKRSGGDGEVPLQLLRRQRRI